MDTFWSNTIWYVLLAVLGLITVFISVLKSRHKIYTLILYFAAVGFSAFGEIFIDILGNAYEYMPKIKKIKELDDVFGGVFSQMFSLSSAAILISVFQLKWYWILVTIGVFFGIEELFLYLGIYELNWWKTWYTVIVLVPFFLIIKSTYKKIQSTYSVFLNYAVAFFALYAVLLSIDSILVFELGLRYTYNIMGNIIKSTILLSILHTLLISLIYTIIRIFRVNVIASIFVVVLLTVFDYLLVFINIITLNSMWHISFLIIVNITGYFVSLYLYNFFKSKSYLNYI